MPGDRRPALPYHEEWLRYQGHYLTPDELVLVNIDYELFLPRTPATENLTCFLRTIPHGQMIGIMPTDIQGREVLSRVNTGGSIYIYDHHERPPSYCRAISLDDWPPTTRYPPHQNPPPDNIYHKTHNYPQPWPPQ